MLRLSIFICSLITLAACNTKPSAQHAYWDSKAYFESETIRLRQKHITLQKELHFDERNEHTTNDTPNWTKELDPFIAIDLNMPGYSGRFTVDTLTLNDGEYTVEYKAKDEQTDLRNCSVNFKQGKIITVSAIFGSTNTLYKSDKQFTYKPDSGYSISGYQSVQLSNPVSYTIKGIFVAP